ncbi:SIR2 family protein [Halomonas kalidii]|uniref:SIR2 family protein n=1 Tax=Halomonas kalidii TaxID=3043293 RepID=A0ABT6VQU0_9GAMM|nr:SIR2 family protein [Halomonas kalidii]MDI5936359.1 SIR2 family protein [Halomonas kalidii]
MSLKTRIENHLNQFATAPFLFVGSGVSRRYLGLEDWEGLLRRYARDTGRPYEYYRATAGGDLPTVATEIARQFHQVWWDSSEFEVSREEYAVECKTETSALKVEISQYIKDQSEEFVDNPQLIAEVDALRNAVIDGVITTNWDLFLEDIFSEFRVFIGQDQLLFSEPQAIGEIYKIHGCCSLPNSLVLTHGDYDQFQGRNPYLAAKLLAVFVEHPVIFLGYSLNDPNIIAILRSIAVCLTTENINKLQDRLIFIQWDPEEPEFQLSATTVVAEGFNIPVVAVRTATLLPVFEALSSVHRRFPARLLRQLKEHVYDLVSTNDPKSKIFVQEIDAEADISELEVVFGVGSIERLRETGYRGFTREDVLRDLIFGERDYDPRRIVTDTLPTLLKGAKYVPVFKYLRGAGLLDDTGNPHGGDLDYRVVQAANAQKEKFDPPAYYTKKRDQVIQPGMGIAQMEAQRGAKDVIYYGALIDKQYLVKDELRDFLVRNYEFLEAANALDQTQYIKLVCLLDFIEFKQGV